jgi:maleamate amidohydrolase
MARSAVFVIDMLNDSFVHAELERARPGLCSSINELTSYARANDVPVIWVRQEFEADLSDAFLDMKRQGIRMYIKDTPGVRIIDELVRDESDMELIKKRHSMFYGTQVERLLQELGVDHLVLAGVNTHACIRTAAIDAYQRDMDVTIVRDCVASMNRDHHEISLRYMDGGIARVVNLPEFLEEQNLVRNP